MKSFVLTLSIAIISCAHHNGGGDDEGGGDGGTTGGTDASGPTSDADTTFAIAPLAKVITTAPGSTPTVQYTATLGGTSVAPEWTIDKGELGNLDVSSGLFTTGGTIGGTAHVSATLGSATASTTLEIDLQQVENGDPGFPAGSAGAGGYGGVGGDGPAGSAGSDQINTLSGSATSDAAVHVLYPYDRTVWPRGLLAPMIAWDPATHTFDAVMIKLHSKHFDYTGTFGANAAKFLNLPIPSAVWNTLTYSNEGGGDDVAVSITFSDSVTKTAVGPYALTWHIAPGTLKGTVYYNSYGTSLVINSGQNDFDGKPFGAATLGIKPGATAPVVIAGSASTDNSGCRVCHTVSANGQTLITQHGNNYAASSVYDLQTDAESVVAGTANVWPALAPDGSWYMTTSGASVATGGDTTSRAYSGVGVLQSPQPTMAPAGLQATLPVFSPDGKHMSFNFWGSTSSGGDKKSLASLAYDATTQTFSAITTLFTPITGVVSWSSFLPTNDAVVFEDELVSGAGQFGYTWKTGQGQLYWVDLATQTAHTLDALNGVGSNGPYLPTYGAYHTGSADTKLNFEPTVNPVVSGGYAWVVFTSRRLYGNVATTSAYNSDPRSYDWRNVITPKKLWVAAIDLNAPPGTDPSHPAFYLPAQELYAGNARGVWTVDPCQADGTSCETGDECCGGYCREGSGGGGTVCTSQQPTCSMEYEACTSDSDCCGGSAAGIYCIDGHCAQETTIQ
ncbi:MAG TPA: hypothetical protein VH143_08400 [Kofleriaceae bacterium]|jgi:hypothetical protein|nr:hypothetical protein [Kofleriaceae bacterium]